MDIVKNIRWLGDHLNAHAKSKGIGQGSEGARYCWNSADEITKLRTELLQAQADNARLRDVLEKIRTAHLFNARTLSTTGVHAICFEALATNSPDDALKEYGAKLVEKIAESNLNDPRTVGMLVAIADKIRKGEFE